MKRPRDIAKLRYWCIRRRGEGVPVNQICTNAQIPRRTFYNWWNRYRRFGLEGLKPKSKAPRTIHRVSPIVAERATALRREKGWGPQLIAGYLATQGIKVGSTTIYRTICREGLNHPLTKPRTKRTYKRWQRRHPNSLWQCDLKVVGARWLITILDDHSRYVTGSHIFNEGTTENVIWLLDKAVHEYAKPREILIDHGSQFWSVRKGESVFGAYCEGSKIKHILGGIGKPTTLGKIERWFRTYDLEHARFQFHSKFVEYYNWERPHMALNYKTPAEVYFKDVPHVVE
jgi:transposase InsO family protein